MVHKLREGPLVGEACTTDAHSLQHTTTAQLVQRVEVLKQPRLVEAVGLDAAHIVWLHGVQLRHQFTQLLLELAAD